MQMVLWVLWCFLLNGYTRIIRTPLISHFRLIRHYLLDTLPSTTNVKSLTSEFVEFLVELSGSDCTCMYNCTVTNKYLSQNLTADL